MQNPREFFSDLDKVLCWLSGRKLDEIATTYLAIDRRLTAVNRGADYREVFYSEFFKIRIFKKGTVHLDFLDEKLLERFNFEVAKGRGWVGGGY